MSPSVANAVAVATAGNWLDEPIQVLSVKALGAFSTTADGACLVQMEDGTLAYVKPRPDAERNHCVAHEKIAADLAHALGLPVAPVVIRAPEPDAGWPHHSAMSLSCLASGRHWSEGGEAHVQTVCETLEELRVFWTWIGDVDHGGHGQNLLYQVRDGVVEVSAIDHSYSLGHGGAADPLTIPASSGYGTAHLPACTNARERAVTNIINLGWPEVDKIVRRLGSILTNLEQEHILRILKERRDHLRRLLGLEG